METGPKDRLSESMLRNVRNLEFLEGRLSRTMPTRGKEGKRGSTTRRKWEGNCVWPNHVIKR